MNNYYKMQLEQIINLSSSLSDMMNNVDTNLKDGRIIDAYNQVWCIKSESATINRRATNILSSVENDISKTKTFVSSLREELANYITMTDVYDIDEYYRAYDFCTEYSDIELVHEYIKALGIKSFYLKLSLLKQ